MREIEIGIRHHGCPVSETSAEYPHIQIQNISKVEGGEMSKRLLGLRGSNANIRSFAEDFRNKDDVEKFEKIAEANNMTYFSGHIDYHDNPSIASIVESLGCFQHSTVTVQKGIENWVLYSKEQKIVRDLISQIEGFGNEVNLYQSVDVGEVSGSKLSGFAGLSNHLTPAQKNAFKKALQIGYYDADEDISIKEVANILDRHPTTVWEHLEKAESKILTDVGVKIFNFDN